MAAQHTEYVCVAVTLEPPGDPKLTYGGTRCQNRGLALHHSHRQSHVSSRVMGNRVLWMHLAKHIN